MAGPSPVSAAIFMHFAHRVLAVAWLRATPSGRIIDLRRNNGDYFAHVQL